MNAIKYHPCRPLQMHKGQNEWTSVRVSVSVSASASASVCVRAFPALAFYSSEIDLLGL